MKVGDKVICVDATNVPELTGGAVYEILFTDDTHIRVNNRTTASYLRRRFNMHVVLETCTCSIVQLLQEGCKCGQMEREKT